MIALFATLLAVVTTPYAPVSYACDGSTAAFTVNFPYLSSSDLTVTSTTAGGVVTTLSLTTDFTTSVSSTQSTATLTLLSPSTKCPSGSTLKISRNMAITQPTGFRQQTSFNPAIHEAALDRLAMQTGELSFKEATDLGNVNNTVAAFNSSGAAIGSTTSILATGTTTPRTLAARAADLINVKDEGAKGDGVTDDSVALQAAVSLACANSKGVYIPSGVYVVSSTITGCSNISIRGDSRLTSVLQPTISDGVSAVLSFPAASGNFTLADFSILSTMNTTNFNAGSATAQQCIGIKMVANTTRFSMTNVHVRGVKTGFDITGFIITGNNVWAEYNEVGFKCTTCNSVDLNLRLENNRQEFTINTSAGVNLRQLLSEGANTVYSSSTIDGSSAVVMTAPYFEGTPLAPHSVPFLTVGGTTLVNNFSIVSGHASASSGFTTGTYPIALDRVTSASVDMHFADGAQTRKVSTTANTKDFRMTATSDFDWHMDASKQLGPALNYWPNRQFDMWLRGYKTVLATRSTFSQETTTVRKGANAFKVFATVGTNQNHTDIQIDGPAITALRGKTVRLGAWIFVPNITEYDESARTALPAILAESFNGTVTLQSTVTNDRAGRNAWNFFWAEVTMQVDATRFDAIFFPNESATNATGNENIIVGSVTLVESTVPLSRQMADDLPDSPLIRAVGVNGSMVSYGTAAPTDANQTYAVGDTVFNSAPSAGGVQGWTCTVAGSPGTWTTFGPVGLLQATLSAGTTTATVASGCRAICTDTTAAAAIRCSVSGTTLTLTGTGTDVINYFCF